MIAVVVIGYTFVLFLNWTTDLLARVWMLRLFVQATDIIVKFEGLGSP